MLPLALEVPLFGVLSLWLVGLLPAAAVTLMKARYLYFMVGFITFGLCWLIGAFALADPQSWWARRFYGPDLMARAHDPERHPRSLGRVLGTLAGVALALAAAGLLVARPAPLLGVGAEALATSVDGYGSPPCEHRGADEWTCLWSDGSSQIVYRVVVNGVGCWSADRDPDLGVGPKRRTGCLRLPDYL